MIAKNLLTTLIKPLYVTDSVSDALQVMNDAMVKHLPILDAHQQLMGIIAEDDAFNWDTEAPLSAYLATSPHQPRFVAEGDHLYDVLRVFGDAKLTIIPVLNEEKQYVGLITIEDLLRYVANSASVTERGSIIVLEMQRNQYSLAELSRIIEAENGIILSTFIANLPDPEMIEVTIKINKENLQYIINSLERMGYQVKAYFTEHQFIDSLKERYDALMMYLNV